MSNHKKVGDSVVYHIILNMFLPKFTFKKKKKTLSKLWYDLKINYTIIADYKPVIEGAGFTQFVMPLSFIRFCNRRY